MSRLLAKLICLAAGGVAGWQVWLNLAEVIEHRWLPLAIGGAAAVAVLLLLYFLVARPIADLISDRMSALHSRVRSTRAGVGLDEVPDRPRASAPRQLDTCRLCGAPGGPVCPKCQAEMRRG
jgi:hypothetical protein